MNAKKPVVFMNLREAMLGTKAAIHPK